MQKADASIEVISEGTVKVTAKKDVTVLTSGGNVSIEAQSGDLTLKGTNLTLEAKGDVSVKGVNVKLAAQASAELSGVSAKVAGQASAELSASGATTVKGAVVKIN